MGSAINNCSTTSTALGSDSTGGFGWVQWAGGNDMSWGFTNKSNYPFGESLGKPQFVTSSIFIFIYKLFSVFSTPICGLNLMVLLGYMSTALVMFGFVKWLLKRFDIALFAGYAAAFVPFHLLKSESHINYIYGSIFIGIVWAYLWMLEKPSYRRASLFAAVSSIGFYFDGYYIFMCGVLIVGLFMSSFAYDIIKILLNSKSAKVLIKNAKVRLKFLLVSSVLLAVLLLPILITFKLHGTEIQQSLSSVRSNIKVETLIYGVRPLEFVLPSYNNPLMPDTYPGWRATKLHGSNFSESTLFVGFTVLIMATVSIIYLMSRKHRRLQFRGMSYLQLVATTLFVTIFCLSLSVPAYFIMFKHHIPTPVYFFVKLTANWRVLSRLFLAIDPLFIILASLGLYVLTQKRHVAVRVGAVVLCFVALFFEYLPAPLHPSGDLYKSVPPIYEKISRDDSVKIVAEYPLADFSYTPGIFTYQPVHKKTLVNANDGSISKGPFDASIAGLNDIQTLGVLKHLKVDTIISHGAEQNTPNLTLYLEDLKKNADGSNFLAASSFAYRITESVKPRNTVLVIEKGYDYLSLDNKQVSHRIIITEAQMQSRSLNKASQTPKYHIMFDANSICPTSAKVSVIQNEDVLWSGLVGSMPTAVDANITGPDFKVRTELCSVDITNLSSEAVD